MIDDLGGGEFDMLGLAELKRLISNEQCAISNVQCAMKATVGKMTNKKAIPEIRFKGFSDLPAGRQALGNWCVYVLLCDDGSLYKGKTNNIKRRLNEHISGNGAEHTKRHKPIKLVYIEYFEAESEALQKEKYLKSGGGREWLKANMLSAI